ncbi:hypothetical protein RJT34_11676 [Clitoria ternatea]|uniref:Biogenesis of lysosome-related organelles complex 1 subunit 1 n=1 Tax=Clitoria ternatea TaxID=43366 RepID=A0AAN9JKD2_CLITE
MDGLEASLQHLVNLHHHKSLIIGHHTDKAKKDAIRKAERVSDLLVEAVNGGVQDSFINQKRIEHEIRALSSTITTFLKQTDQWLSATHALNIALKEIGDFENWMKIMEYDCKSITAAIQNIHQDFGGAMSLLGHEQQAEIVRGGHDGLVCILYLQLMQNSALKGVTKTQSSWTIWGQILMQKYFDDSVVDSISCKFE